MSARRGASLALLAARAAALCEPAALLSFARQLDGDPRAGARALAARCRARAEAAARERERLDSLLGLRRALGRAGARVVAGVDEVGVGPLAGPVVAAAVVLPEAPWLPGLDDSKRLSPSARERLAAEIRRQAVAVAVAEVGAHEIDRLNIHRASLLAMRRAVLRLAARPDHVLVDARCLPGLSMPQTALVGGDARDASIAAASIVAKVHRDALMARMDGLYPAYGFGRHMGYGTPAHLAALRRVGPCPEHRRSFAPVAELAFA